jgi:hypothetical protein
VNEATIFRKGGSPARISQRRIFVKHNPKQSQNRRKEAGWPQWVRFLSPVPVLTAFVLQALPAHASIFKGETLDKVADVLTWIVLIVAPLAAIVIFLLIHILPEKIAEKKKHPQAKAIQCLCLLSLVFGGMLWPLAWLWAFTKPVLHKMAYGTDKEEHGHADGAPPPPVQGETQELQRLRQRIAELESKLAAAAVPETAAAKETPAQGAIV